ncbi:MAG TPA: hypothetical protein VF530_11790, partial [Planctomycetota bacterium]
DLTRDPAVADSFRVLDAEGQALQLIESFGVGFSLDTSARFQDGLSAVLSVRETAAELVLSRAGLEVLRRPLTLDPELRTVVRP